VSDTEISDESVEIQENLGQETGDAEMSDSKVDAIAALVVIACLVAIAATFISGGLA